MKTVTVNRSKWARGKSSHLAEDDGKCCILGLCLNQIDNIPVEWMLGKSNPEQVHKTYAVKTSFSEYIPEKHVFRDLRGCDQAISINDDRLIFDYSEMRREEKLADLFLKEFGIRLLFVD
jgi:hypothetical protein